MRAFLGIIFGRLRTTGSKYINNKERGTRKCDSIRTAALIWLNSAPPSPLFSHEKMIGLFLTRQRDSTRAAALIWYIAPPPPPPLASNHEIMVRSSSIASLRAGADLSLLILQRLDQYVVHRLRCIEREQPHNLPVLIVTTSRQQVKRLRGDAHHRSTTLANNYEKPGIVALRFRNWRAR